MLKIPFNKPTLVGKELLYLDKLISNAKLSGDGEYSKKCHDYFKNTLGSNCTLLTNSCTAALEMASLISNLKAGDEVIMPSYTFVSTANAVALRGAVPVFVDINPETMNINEHKIKDAINAKTRSVIAVHYGSVSCDMDEVINICNEYNLVLIEDAAQCIDSYYKRRPLGTLGDFGAFSFHDTKNIHCGEGGLLSVNNNDFVQRSIVVREKGTNRQEFLDGVVDKYTWVDIGSSYLPSDISAAFLYAQLLESNDITENRLYLFKLYFSLLSDLKDKGCIELPFIPEYSQHNGHIFYIKTKDKNERYMLMQYLNENGISSVFHYIPLHKSPFGSEVGRFHGADIHTTTESERLLRLPMYHTLKDNEVEYICERIKSFYDKKYPTSNK